MNKVEKVNAIVDVFGDILTFEVTSTNGQVEMIPYATNSSLECMIAEYIVPQVKKAKWHGKNHDFLEIVFENGKTLTINESNMSDFNNEAKNFITTGELANNNKNITLFSYLLSSACKRYNCSTEELRKEPTIRLFQGMLAEITAKSKFDGYCDLAIKTCGLERFIKRKERTFYNSNEGLPDKNGIRKVTAITDLLGNTVSYLVTMFSGETYSKTLEEAKALAIEYRASEKKPPAIKQAKYTNQEKTILSLTFEDGNILNLNCSPTAYTESFHQFFATKTLQYDRNCIDLFSYMILGFCQAYKCTPQELLKNPICYSKLEEATSTLSKKSSSMTLGEIIIKECGLERFFSKSKSNIERLELKKFDIEKKEQYVTKRKGLMGFIIPDVKNEIRQNRKI